MLRYLVGIKTTIPKKLELRMAIIDVAESSYTVNFIPSSV